MLETFPGVVMNRYLFHWKQAIHRKIIELNFNEDIFCERMVRKDLLEVLTIINTSEIKCKGIPFVHSIVDHGLEQDDSSQMEKSWKYFEK